VLYTILLNDGNIIPSVNIHYVINYTTISYVNGYSMFYKILFANGRDCRIIVTGNIKEKKIYISQIIQFMQFKICMYMYTYRIKYNYGYIAGSNNFHSIHNNKKYYTIIITI